jgi:hypothetical protein
MFKSQAANWMCLVTRVKISLEIGSLFSAMRENVLQDQSRIFGRLVLGVEKPEDF